MFRGPNDINPAERSSLLRGFWVETLSAWLIESEPSLVDRILPPPSAVLFPSSTSDSWELLASAHYPWFDAP